ncbi:putative Alternative oxidase domain (AOX) protein [Trachipleistophora hominis]|uniref:Ubiquinol oxidase n=1 Tax=Trachipleistophora hominis TaxID=72359 RepID=AOX_TRAHO|nr:RecName: Full=Ubiquinol oxidase; AltName: Full=Alternative oxidase [Trachipleistophora hominis]ADE43749.1 alternative oxidase [Trachipleistophora hominis]ELQ74912.1 putative Alternative oxidase domain (AOX) protein [Trachipleistophora hominis]
MLTKNNSLLSRLPARISFGLKISNKNVNSTYSNVASAYCEGATYKKNGVSRLQNELLSQKTNNETIPVPLQHFIRPAAKHSIFTQIKGYGERSRPEFERPITLEELKSLDYESGKHFVPQSFSDTFAYLIVKGLRAFADLYFQKDYVRRVVVLETVAAIPGMVGGMFRHLYSLRNLEDNGEAIKKLVLEAENERQHLLTFLAVLKPNVLDRMLIKLGQFLFFNGYMVFYFVAPRTAHRFVGYLEEEAVRSYDAFEEEILLGHIKNVEAPRISKDYWNLPEEAMLIDVVRAVRADEAEHRDVNHKMADSKSFSLAHNPY